VLFERRLREGISQGQIVLAFRRWKRCQVVAGHRYRTGAGLVEAVSVDVVTDAGIDAVQAREAGYGSVGELLAGLRGNRDLPLYRIRFLPVNEPDPRDELASSPAETAGDLAALTARLARMDAASTRGPWTTAILAQIDARPGIVSTVLADERGWARQDFKAHVRRLKELGLTVSLDTGYRLSPRGEYYLRHIRDHLAG